MSNGAEYPFCVGDWVNRLNAAVSYTRYPVAHNDWADWPVTETIVFGETVTPTVTATPGHGACPWCSGEYTNVIHSGPCPRVKAFEYHLNGTVKRVEFNKPTDGD